MEIGKRIKLARSEKGYTQEELGNLIGVQKSAVAKWENGRVVNIKRSVLAKLSQVLEIPPVELVSDIEEKPAKPNNDSVDWIVSMERTEDNPELADMLIEYQKLDKIKQAQVREYVYLLSRMQSTPDN